MENACTNFEKAKASFFEGIDDYIKKGALVY